VGKAVVDKGDYVEVTVVLPKTSVDAWQQLAEQRDTDETKILIQAISLEYQLDKEVSQGARILILKDGVFGQLDL
jgi:hypothetical protein